MNKAGVAVAGFCSESRKVELLKGIGLDPFNNPIQNAGIQFASRIGILSRNALIHESEETRSEGVAGCYVQYRKVQRDRSQLYKVKGYNVSTLVVACAALALSALVASAMPARRASSVEPMQALRTE
jgi:hypothetical protein